MEDATIKRVLLVEDVEIARKAITIALNRLGIDVLSAETAKKAIELFLQYNFDLVLMDLGLPDLDGISLTQKLRSVANRNRDVPIIALTAHADEEIKQNCMNAGMQDFFTKPVTPEMVRIIIEKYCPK